MGRYHPIKTYQSIYKIGPISVKKRKEKKKQRTLDHLERKLIFFLNFSSKTKHFPIILRFKYSVCQKDTISLCGSFCPFVVFFLTTFWMIRCSFSGIFNIFEPLLSVFLPVLHLFPVLLGYFHFSWTLIRTETKQKHKV